MKCSAEVNGEISSWGCVGIKTDNHFE